MTATLIVVREGQKKKPETNRRLFAHFCSYIGPLYVTQFDKEAKGV